jgi:hypothetical protein
MSNCLSPDCDGSVFAQSLTDGHCDGCGLHHRRHQRHPLKWDQIVGPVVVTLFGSAGDARTEAGYVEVVDADSVRFADRLTIDRRHGTTVHMATVPATRLLGIVARD